jgi:hypothetical protein
MNEGCDEMSMVERMYNYFKEGAEKLYEVAVRNETNLKKA